MRDLALDLLLGGRCAGCGRPGRLLCRGCATVCTAEPRAAWPAPVPPGLAPPWASAAYDGVVRALVLHCKERGRLGLARTLGALLAEAVAVAVGGGPGPWVLVPVPSRHGTVRARGYDSTARITAAAAARLRSRGIDALTLPMLRLRTGVADQSGLSAADRATNLAGSMCCPTAAVRRLARLRAAASLVVCDDVLTTGSTAREAQRALEASGLRVAGIAVAAATERRLPPEGDRHRTSR